MGSACLEATCPVKSLSTEGTAYEEDFFGGDKARAFQPHCREERVLLSVSSVLPGD